MDSLRDRISEYKLTKEVDFHRHNWDILKTLFEDKYPTISLSDSHENYNPVWEVKETLEEELIFHLIRNKMTNQRITKVDIYGILGLSTINLKNTHTFLTEGISDFISTKLLFPEENVLGLTKLSGSYKAKLLYSNMFESFTIISDNDFTKSSNTGMNNSLKMRDSLVKLGKKVVVDMPESRYNDISDNFIKSLRISTFQ